MVLRMMNWLITPLASHHDRSVFACGQPTLDRFLKQSARQNQDKGMSRTFVATQADEVRIVGYYTLSAGHIDHASLPLDVRKQLPKYPVPMVRLGRLAVDESVKGKGLGGELLWDALNRSLAASEAIGVYAVCVEAIDEIAASFYRHYEFLPLPDQPLQLFLPLNTIRGASPS
jgi:predicted N-acetyltransferase YhbS